MVTRADARSVLQKLDRALRKMGSASFREQFPASLVDIDVWEWPQGIGLYGLWKYYERVLDPSILDYLVAWYDKKLALGPLSVERNVNTTAPLLALTHVYEATGRSDFLEIIAAWADWVRTGLIRTGDGAFQHMITGDPNADQILIDTLFMVILFLARASHLLAAPDLAAEAEYQILIHAKYLLDKGSGLFYHGWNFAEQHNYGAVRWARGNAWFTAGIMELLETGIFRTAADRYLRGLYRNQCSALLQHQDSATGLWHTVLTDPASPLENSGSAGILYGMLRGIRTGVLETDIYLSAVEKGVLSLRGAVTPEGILKGVSYGTPVAMNQETYAAIPEHPMPYGQALAMMVFAELMDDFWQNV